MKTIDGEDQPLSEYRGQVLMVVNTASGCGFTPQYAGLEDLYRKYHERGFTVLGFPANDFKQEEGSDEEIKEFCSLNYEVSFPMFSKISVTGEDQHALYQYLTEQPEPVGGDVKWNFQKYLVDRDGNVVRRISSRRPPDDPEIVAQIEELLGE